MKPKSKRIVGEWVEEEICFQEDNESFFVFQMNSYSKSFIRFFFLIFRLHLFCHHDSRESRIKI